MTVSYVSSSAVEANSITLPTHQAGDLIVIYAAANPQATITIPSGWIVVSSRQNSASLSSIVAFRIAASSSETSGTWTNATHMCVGVYRDTDNYLVVNGANEAAANPTTTINYPALPISGAGPVMTTNNWVAAFGMASLNSTDFETAPSGMTNRTSLAGASVGEIVLHDTNGTVVSWTATTRTNSGSVSYHTRPFSIEDTGISKAGGKPILPFTQGVIG